MRRRLGPVVLGAVLVLPGCQRDAGQDVQPMSAPLAGTTSQADVIPLEDVRKSQAAAPRRRPGHRDRDHA